MIEFEGFDDLQRELEELAENARRLDGTNEVPLTDLFPPSFIRRHSRFVDIEALFEASPWTVATADDFATIPDDEWDEFIDEHTSFQDWESMQGAGAQEWVARELGLS